MHHANVTLCRYCLAFTATTTTITTALRDANTTITIFFFSTFSFVFSFTPILRDLSHVLIH